MMTKGDPEGRIFLFYPYTNDRFFFLLTIVLLYLFIYLFIYNLFQNKNAVVPEKAKMQFHMMTLIDVLGKIHVAWVR